MSDARAILGVAGDKEEKGEGIVFSPPLAVFDCLHALISPMTTL